ncbi:hypothetical protein J6590_097834, partial [Homalodisca vitripennis]
MKVVVNDESKHSTFSRINIVICFIPCGGPTVICFIPCGSRAADPLDGHQNLRCLRSDRLCWIAEVGVKGASQDPRRRIMGINLNHDSMDEGLLSSVPAFPEKAGRNVTPKRVGQRYQERKEEGIEYIKTCTAGEIEPTKDPLGFLSNSDLIL